MAQVEASCLQGHVRKWRSQPLIGEMPLGNFVIAASKLLSGCSPGKILLLFHNMQTPSFTERTYHRIQKLYLIPSILEDWKSVQKQLLRSSQGIRRLGGDGRNSNFNVEINALVVPTICSPIQGQTIRFAKKMYPHLQNLQSADFPNENDLNVDVLLGSDTILRVFTGEFVKGESIEDPVAVGTNFGLVLSGVVSDIPRNLLSSVNLAILKF